MLRSVNEWTSSAALVHVRDRSPRCRLERPLWQSLDFARAVESTLDKVISLPLDRTAIEQTAEEIRTVAKEARNVVADAYDSQTLEAFQDALTPAFARSLPSKYGTPQKVDDYNAGA